MYKNGLLFNSHQPKEQTMTKESHETAMAAHEQDTRMHNTPMKHQPGVKDEVKDVMHAPKDGGEKHMGGVHKGNDHHIGNSGMGHAVKQLEYETERGSHTPHVGGHKAHSHSGVMVKD